MNNDINEKIVHAAPVPPFVRFVASAVPMVFDNSLSYYEALCALWKWMQDNLVEVVNNNASVTEEYIQLTNQMKEYMDNYFDNLDVQEEINNKLDDLVADGTIPDIINGRLDYISTELNNRISSFEVTVGNEVAEINRKVNAAVGITPTVVATTDEMTDKTKIYVVTATNKWYYYANNQWNEGGDYNSDAGESLIKWYITNISTTDGNLLDPDKCKDNYGLTSATGEEAANSSYWITDYMEMPTFITPPSDIKRNGLIKISDGLGGQISKICLYDENKNFLGTGTVMNKVLIVTPTSVTGDVVYVRLQFHHDGISYERRNKIICVARDYTTGYDKTFRNVTDINSGNCSTSIFEPVIGDKIASQLFNSCVFPFNANDFSNATISTSYGKPYFNIQRLSVNRLIRVNHGIKITLTGGWTMLAFEYRDDGTYIGRYVSDWTTEVLINRDANLKFLFQKADANINTPADITNLIDNISLTTFSNTQTYYGDRISLDNTFSTISTRLRGLEQDGASYSNIVLFCNGSGRYKVYDINGDILKNESYIAEYTQFIPHFNSVCFGTEKFADTDNYPLFYGNAYNNTALPRGALYAYRLKNDYTTEYKQSIVVGFAYDNIWTGGGDNLRPYGNFAIDTDHNYLYAFTMIDNLQVTRFFKFKMPTLADGSTVTLTTDDIIDQFDAPYETALQGCCYYNGKIYSLSGFGEASSPALLHVIDLINKRESSRLGLGNIEPEAVFVNDNKLYMGHTSILQYKFD